jgi:ABC-type multidrug transport system fused ATPase/permease subunit
MVEAGTSPQVRTRLGGLDAVVTARGDELSLGEKQLLCIARVFLCKARVLVFDEASSSVDADVGRRIHQSLSGIDSDDTVDPDAPRAFRGGGGGGGDERPTVLIIAHRLSSIDACQTLLVMDAGTLVEQGSPAALRARPNSKFAAMAAANAL